jgi:hypothetical protein
VNDETVELPALKGVLMAMKAGDPEASVVVHDAIGRAYRAQAVIVGPAPQPAVQTAN